MDAFDTIRERAARLHDKLVAGGVDPLDPTAMVSAAIRELDLQLTWLDPGDPALKGARAVLDEQSGTICCEKTKSVGEGALLVAHEIGHSCVHAGSTSCTADDIDLSQPTEAAPLGIQRIEDYGPRERRELQANVFAREFLLPRALVRRLHVEGHLGAKAIAEKTGLPKGLVCQQIFDALLLPSPVDAPAVIASAHPPRSDPSQDRAASHRGAPFQLQAGPGTGKTRTLVKRVLSLLDDGTDPASILILTFSNRAAGELAERIATMAKEKASRIWIGTFHAFGLDLVRRYHDRLGLSPNPSLFDRSDAIEVLQDILPTLPLVHYRNLWDPVMVLRDVVAAISRAKDELVDPTRYRALAETMRDRAVDDDARKMASKCLEVALIYDLYEKALRDRGAVDFGDLIMRPAQLLESEASLRVSVELRHRHILVDEYQDVNRASARLLKTISGDGKRLWVVGDSRQSIYRFRGASSANMSIFVNDYQGAKVDRLTVNYRSTEEIVKTFVSLAPSMGASREMLPLELKADRGSGHQPEIRRFETLDDEAAGIAASIRELESAGVQLRNQAVLCRSNARLNEVAAELEARGIPVLHLGSFFEREEVRDLLALLSLVVDPFGDGIARVGAMPRYSLSLQDVYVASRFLRESKQPALDGIASLPSAPGLSDKGAISLKLLAGDFKHFKTSTSAWDFLSTYLLDRTDLARTLGECSNVATQMRAVAVWQLLNFVRGIGQTGSGPPIRRTLDRIRQLVLLAEERDLRQLPAAALGMDAVRLMTVHGSKGLEFDAVHVPGLTVASFPSSNRGQRCPPPIGMIEQIESISVSDEAKAAHEHEEECLFFVALSRARTYLRMYLIRRQSNGKNRNPSPFIGWIPVTLITECVNPATLPLPPGSMKPECILVMQPADRKLTDSSLRAYEKCPRRFFYTHILGLGGGRKATAFSRTQDCIFELWRWLVDARRAGLPTLEAAEKAFDEIWQARGPTDHGFANDYRRLASRFIAAMIRSGDGRQYFNAAPFEVKMLNGQLVVEPDEVAVLPDGTVVLRRMRTGHKTDNEYDRLEYALYHLAAQMQFGNSAKVEAVHLAEDTVETVTLTAKVIGKRRNESDEMLANIRAGRFPVNIDAITCPRCPHFFICAASPQGSLTLS